MKKRTWIGIALVMLVSMGGLNAAPVGFSKAKDLAEEFYRVQSRSTKKNLPEFVCVYPASRAQKADAPYYIFNVGENQGFVIVSGDDNTRCAVLGYSDHGRFEMTGMPENVRSWLAFYEEGVKLAAEAPVQKQSPRSFEKSKAVVEPLLGTISYDQSLPYNGMCPTDPVDERLSYTGCVATALAMIAKYYEYPEKGNGSVDYITSTRGIHVTADLSQSHYDWANILPAYGSDTIEYTQEQNDAVALLMRDFGYAVDMDYTSAFSGAYTDPIINGVVDHMGFDSVVSVRERDAYDTQEDWESLLRHALDNGMPLYYQGYGDGGGHAFVCDGYADDGYFHINWGWGGWCDGYFLVHVMDPGDISGAGAGTGGGYARGQEVLLNLVPPGQALENDYFLTAEDVVTFSTRMEEDSLYDMAEPLQASMGRLENKTKAFFNGYVAFALYSEDEFVSVISDSVSLSLGYDKKGEVDAVFDLNLDGVADGEYEIWKVCRSQQEGSAWNKIFATRKDMGELSCMPIVISGGKVGLNPASVLLSVFIDNPVSRQNVSTRIKRNGVLLGTVNMYPEGDDLELLKGVYDFEFFMRGFDTTYVKGLNLQRDTTLSIKMNQTILDPYIRICRVSYNTMTMLWFACDPREEVNMYPEQYVVYMDSVVVDTLDAEIEEYVFRGLSLGTHTVGLRALYVGGVSDIVTRNFEVVELANEEMEENAFYLLPNPSADGRFRLMSGRAADICLFSATGQVLLQGRVEAGENELDLSAYESGYYYLRIVSGSKVEVIKMLKL